MTYDYDRRASKPQFLDYEQAQDWIKQKAKEYGGLRPFTSSPEYHAVYPEIARLQKEEQKKYTESVLAKTGLKVGDVVQYSQLNLLMGGVIVARGPIVLRGGKLYVKLEPPVLGRHYVKWHPGFQKI